LDGCGGLADNKENRSVHYKVLYREVRRERSNEEEKKGNAQRDAMVR